MVFGAEEIVFSKFENVEVQSELDENGQMYLCGSFGKRKSYNDMQKKCMIVVLLQSLLCILQWKRERRFYVVQYQLFIPEKI